MENYYQILGVAYDASNEEIKKTYKLKAKEYHPDVSKIPNAAEIFKKINNAKDILLDTNKRLQLDYYLGVKVNPEPGNNYNNNQYGGYQQPQQQESSNNAWWVLLIIFIIALIFGSSNNKDRRY